MSVRFPQLLPAILMVKRSYCFIRDQVKYANKFARAGDETYQYSQYSSRSLLRRRLGSSNPDLQEKKIINIKRALDNISVVNIGPGQVFSLWNLLGNTTYRKGYTDGMVISGGKVGVGPGGGLCQLANLLHWVLIHTDLTYIERFHHSYDVFPDNGRTLPFGSGATIFYNLIDLKFRNDTNMSWQLRVWLDDEYVNAEVLTKDVYKYRHKIKEKYSCFVRVKEDVFRYNQLWKFIFKERVLVSEDRIITNFAPVLYSLPEDKILEFK